MTNLRKAIVLTLLAGSVLILTLIVSWGSVPGQADTSSVLAEARAGASTKGVVRTTESLARSDAHRRVYLAPTLADIQKSVAVLPVENAVDAQAMLAYGQFICDFASQDSGGALSDAADAGKLPRGEQALRSYHIVDSYRKTFCQGAPLRQTIPLGDPVSISLRQAAAAGDGDAQMLVDVEDVLGSEAVQGHERVISDSLKQVMSTTKSPAKFAYAARLLGSEQLGAHVPELYGRGMDVSTRAIAHEFGTQLAVCRKFGFCDQPTVHSIRACMPADCRQGGSMHQYIRNSLSPLQYEAANRFADSLVSSHPNGR